MTAKKKRDWQTPTGAAVAGAGGVTTVGGLAAGGIPRAKVDSIALRHVTENEKIKHAETKPKKVKEFVRNIPKSRKGWQGGMGGFRQSAHYIVESDESRKVHEAAKTPVSEMSHMKAFQHGVSAGKIEPERIIMRQMTGAAPWWSQGPGRWPRAHCWWCGPGPPRQEEARAEQARRHPLDQGQAEAHAE